MQLTYSSYLKIDELLALQQPLSDGPEHDEHLFILIHQVFELWFKQILHELDRLQPVLEAGDTFSSLHGFRRILSIFKTLVQQIDVLETMTPVSFQSFRTRLESSSGFQSLQFRSLEIRLGARGEGVLAKVEPASQARAVLERQMEAPSLFDSFLRYLVLHGARVPRECIERDPKADLVPNAALQAALVNIYRADKESLLVCERMVDLDEGLQEWRYRHVKMVERTIGFKPGTGGSAGAAYLRSTLFSPLYPDLWALRSAL